METPYRLAKKKMLHEFSDTFYAIIAAIYGIPVVFLHCYINLYKIPLCIYKKKKQK